MSNIQCLWKWFSCRWLLDFTYSIMFRFNLFFFQRASNWHVFAMKRFHGLKRRSRNIIRCKTAIILPIVDFMSPKITDITSFIRQYERWYRTLLQKIKIAALYTDIWTKIFLLSFRRAKQLFLGAWVLVYGGSGNGAQ